MKKFMRGKSGTAKKILSVLIVMALVLSQLAMMSFATAEDILSISAVTTKQLIKNGDDFNYDEFGQYDRYSYDSYVDITVNYNDGSSYTGDYYSLRERGHTVFFTDDQSAENVWDVGTHPVTVTVDGTECKVDIEIVETPVESITIEVAKPVYLNGKGHEEYDDNGDPFFYYEYGEDLYFNIAYKDGSSYYGDFWDITNLTGRNPWPSDTQYTEHWGPGKHTFTVNILGFEAQGEIEIVENPVKSISVEQQKPVYENCGGWMSSDWETGEEYYNYNYKESLLYTINYKDGSSYTGSYWDISYDLGVEPYISDEQYLEHWGVGKHSFTVSIMGFEAQGELEIIKGKKLQSVEVLTSPTVYEYVNGSWVEGESDWYYEYSTYGFSFDYKVTYDDGASETFTYGYDGSWDSDLLWGIHTEPVQSEDNQWGVGKANEFTVYLSGNYDTPFEGQEFTATGHAEMNPSTCDFDYEIYEENGKEYAYITGIKVPMENVVIPAEVDGYPVASIAQIYNPAGVIKTIKVSDGIEYINKYWLEYATSGVEEIYLGNSVKEIGWEMFFFYDDESVIHPLPDLKKVTVSEDNPYFCSVGNSIYTKDMKTLVYYHIPDGKTYTVPEGVNNFDILFKDAYKDVTIDYENSAGLVKQNGVTYTKDMTRVVTCDTSYDGAYVMPDTVNAVSDGAFKNCEKLTSVVFSDFVKSIGAGMFAGSGVEKVILPEALEDLANGHAFDGAEALKEIVAPDKYIKLFEMDRSLPWFDNQPDGEIYLCRNLLGYSGEMPENTTVTVKDGTMVIGEYAFYGQSNLTAVIFNEGLSEINEGAFTGTSIKSAKFPQGIRYISWSAFDELEEFTVYGFENSGAQDFAEGCGYTFIALDNIVTDSETGTSVSAVNDKINLTETTLKVETLKDTDTEVRYDISLLKNGAPVQPGGTVTVKVPVSEKLYEDVLYNGAAVRAYYYDETDDSYTEINAALISQYYYDEETGEEHTSYYAVFATDHFSTYVITTKEYSNDENSDVLFGDINGDGKISAVDARWALQYTAGTKTLTAEQMTAADVNGDGKITAVDARAILKMTAEN